jgi:monofunctional chorismate mutase
MRDDIKNLRKELDLIDFELVNLLIKRLNIVKEIASVKKEFNLPISDPNREQEIIINLLEKIDSDQYKRIIESLFKEIFKLSKEWQSWIVMD